MYKFEANDDKRTQLAHRIRSLSWLIGWETEWLTQTESNTHGEKSKREEFKFPHIIWRYPINKQDEIVFKESTLFVSSCSVLLFWISYTRFQLISLEKMHVQLIENCIKSCSLRPIFSELLLFFLLTCVHIAASVFIFIFIFIEDFLCARGAEEFECKNGCSRRTATTHTLLASDIQNNII